MAVSAWSNRNDMLTSAVPIVWSSVPTETSLVTMQDGRVFNPPPRGDNPKDKKRDRGKEKKKKQSNVKSRRRVQRPLVPDEAPFPGFLRPSPEDWTGSGKHAQERRMYACMYVCMYVRLLYPQALGLACQGRRCCRQPSPALGGRGIHHAPGFSCAMCMKGSST